MKARAGLTDADVAKAIQTAKANGKLSIIRDTGRTPGLQCVVTPNGVATWSILFTPKGETKPKRLKLAGHGEMIQRGTGHAVRYGLAQARLDAGEHRKAISEGIDPTLEREAAARSQREREAAGREAERQRKVAEAERKAAEARRIKFSQLAELYFAARAPEAPLRQERNLIAFSVNPVIGGIPIENLRKKDLQRVIDDMRARGNTTQCHRALEAFRPIIKWAIERDHLPGDRDGMWLKLSMPKRNGARKRVLAAREIRWLWQQCDRWQAAGLPNIPDIVRLDILLGQRSSETCEMRTSEIIPPATWQIPGERTKNGEPHMVPLASMAREIFTRLTANAKEDRLFVGERGATERADSVAHKLADAIKVWNEAHPDDTIEHFVVHDLRRTMASRLEETGTPLTIIETALNHISGKSGSVTRKHYAHGDLGPLVRLALAKWQGLVQRCIKGEDPFEVNLEDLEAIEARGLAEANGGKPGLRIVS